MYSVRCLCGKIVCQVDHMSYLPRVEEASKPPEGPAIVILCRHCRRYIVLCTPTITDISFTSNPTARSGAVVTTSP